MTLNHVKVEIVNEVDLGMACSTTINSSKEKKEELEFDIPYGDEKIISNCMHKGCCGFC